MSNRIGEFSYKTNIGNVRKTNEDAAIALINASGDVLLVVCDGMGGHNYGDIAASYAIDVLVREFKKHDKFLNLYETKAFLRKAIKKANKYIFNAATKNEKYKKMGTTISVALIRRATLLVANVGDSRVYLANDKLVCLTEDDSYVNYLYQMGKIDREEMLTHPKRHILTKALGLTENINFDIDIHRYKNSRIMLCTDGLYTSLSEEEIITILNTSDSVEERCELLLKTVNRNGGYDNSAVTVWEVSKK